MQRKALAALPLLIATATLSTPASAHDMDSAARMKQVADQFSDPAMQQDISHAVEAVTGAMLDLPVGEFAEVIEDARPGTVDEHINRNTRLGDLAGPDANRIPARVGDSTRSSMAAMGGMIRAFANMLPEFQRLGREIEASVEDARDRH